MPRRENSEEIPVLGTIVVEADSLSVDSAGNPVVEEQDLSRLNVVLSAENDNTDDNNFDNEATLLEVIIPETIHNHGQPDGAVEEKDDEETDDTLSEVFETPSQLKEIISSIEQPNTPPSDCESTYSGTASEPESDDEECENKVENPAAPAAVTVLEPHKKESSLEVSPQVSMISGTPPNFATPSSTSGSQQLSASPSHGDMRSLKRQHTSESEVGIVDYYKITKRHSSMDDTHTTNITRDIMKERDEFLQFVASDIAAMTAELLQRLKETLQSMTFPYEQIWKFSPHSLIAATASDSKREHMNSLPPYPIQSFAKLNGTSSHSEDSHDMLNWKEIPFWVRGKWLLDFTNADEPIFRKFWQKIDLCIDNEYLVGCNVHYSWEKLGSIRRKEISIYCDFGISLKIRRLIQNLLEEEKLESLFSSDSASRRNPIWFVTNESICYGFALCT